MTDPSRARFEAWWDNIADTPAPDTFGRWEESCRQAWQAARKAALEDAMAACDVVIFSANDEAPPGYRTTRAGGAVACRNKIKELFEMIKPWPPR